MKLRSKLLMQTLCCSTRSVAEQQKTASRFSTVQCMMLQHLLTDSCSMPLTVQRPNAAPKHTVDRMSYIAQLSTAKWMHCSCCKQLPFACSQLFAVHSNRGTSHLSEPVQVDLLSSKQAIQEVEDAIHKHNAGIHIVQTSHCSLDISQILNRGAFVGSSQPPSLQMFHQNMHIDSSHASHPSPTVNGNASQHVNAAGMTSSPQSSEGHQADPATSANHQAPAHQHDDETVAAGSDRHGQQHAHSHGDHDHHHDSSVRSISINYPGQVDLTRSVCRALSLLR